jgi:hypothetical protein
MKEEKASEGVDMLGNWLMKGKQLEAFSGRKGCVLGTYIYFVVVGLLSFFNS